MMKSDMNTLQLIQHSFISKNTVYNSICQEKDW